MEFKIKSREDPDIDLNEWEAKITRETSSLRRFSASNLKSFREDAKPLASSSSGITISSTVSSPGYVIREEIDPSTYSFTAALKALQAKTVGTWEYLSPYGYTLNSKWSDAEKYICNPLSGQVPLECLSTKTLQSERISFRSSSNIMSAPLIYTLQSRSQLQAKISINEHKHEVKLTIQEEKEKPMTRDIGIQSTSVDLSSSSSPSPARTPSIEDRPVKKCELEAEDSSLSSEQLNAEETAEVVQAKEAGDDHAEQKIPERNAKKKVTKLRKMLMMMMLCGKREQVSCSCSCISRRNIEKKTSK